MSTAPRSPSPFTLVLAIEHTTVASHYAFHLARPLLQIYLKALVISGQHPSPPPTFTLAVSLSLSLLAHSLYLEKRPRRQKERVVRAYKHLDVAAPRPLRCRHPDRQKRRSNDQIPHKAAESEGVTVQERRGADAH